MSLKDELSIVIPCKNEGKNIKMTLDCLNYQNNIDGVKVIVSDISDDKVTKEQLISRNGDRFELIITQGGLPSVARNNGARLVTTPYILFLDADIFILDNILLSKGINHIKENYLDLLTVRFKTTTREYDSVYDMFYYFQRFTKHISPFCLGGFMMISTIKFNEIGGFDETAKVAEDYLLTRHINSSDFGIINRIVYTTPRRFKNKGMFYMTKLFISSFLNRNNKEYFKQDKGYWL
jgi:glycosyltransferase involved in cell wall biosynthesis